MEAFEETGNGVNVKLKSGKTVAAEMVVLAIGVRPNGALAKEAGLELNARGGVIVDEFLRTSDPSIYAVGDVIEVNEPVLGGKTMIPLAGPANRQGRIAAEDVYKRQRMGGAGGREAGYGGGFSTAALLARRGGREQSWRCGKRMGAGCGHAARMVRLQLRGQADLCARPG